MRQVIGKRIDTEAQACVAKERETPPIVAKNGTNCLTLTRGQ
jgi:hypothetical protein